MATDISELKLAVEKLIELIGQHDTAIENIRMIQEFHSTKLNKTDKTDKTNKTDNADAMDDRIESMLSTLSARIERLEARIGLVELDSTTDHQLSNHNADVVHDWQQEAEAGFNTDMIPLSTHDIMDRFQKYSDRKRR
jgi:hypothetical protein